MKMLGLWWWIDRWRKSTAYTDMTLEEQGAYRNLLDEATLRGGALPTNERVLAKASGNALRWKQVRVAVLARFSVVDGAYRNETLDEVLRQSRRRAKNQAAYRARQKGGNGPDNGRDNGHGNVADNGAANKPAYPDPDPTVQEPPKPPSGEGGRYTRKELAQAEVDLREYRASQPPYVAPVHREPGRVYIEPRRCPHEPEHNDEAVCVVLLAAARRERIARELAAVAS